MEVFLITKSEKVNITNWITSMTLQGEYRSCCRTLDFGIIKSQSDKNTHLTSVFLGNHIEITENNINIFYGVVWEKSKSSNSNEINIHCKDFGIYLVKNSCSYKFKNITPEDITKKICSDFNIPIGEIAKTGITINRNFITCNLYETIITAYTLIKQKNYAVKFDRNKLCIYEKGTNLCAPIKSRSNLLNLDISETLENVVNRIDVYDKNNKFLMRHEDKKLIELYGLLSNHVKLGENESIKVEEKLQDVEQKITVTNIGSIEYTTGTAVMVEEPYTGIKGKFYIDGDQHNWKNGIYTNKLTLNFKNIMDEKESGEYEKQLAKQKAEKQETIVFHKWLD